MDFIVLSEILFIVICNKVYTVMPNILFIVICNKLFIVLILTCFLDYKSMNQRIGSIEKSQHFINTRNSHIFKKSVKQTDFVYIN